MILNSSTSWYSVGAIRAQAIHKPRRKNAYKPLRKVPPHPICEICVSRICEHVSTAISDCVTPPLTENMKVLLKMLSGGLTNKEVAERMEKSEGTIKMYVVRIMERLRLTSRLECAVWALKYPAKLEPKWPTG